MARPKILVFQHVPYEPLGTLDPLLKAAGFRIRYVNSSRNPEFRPTLDKYAALIVLGGPMNSDQIDSYPNLISEIEIIREALEREFSVLGICLGAQLLAIALGGSVTRNPAPSIWQAHQQVRSRRFGMESTPTAFSFILRWIGRSCPNNQSPCHCSGGSCISATCSRNASTCSSQ